MNNFTRGISKSEISKFVQREYSQEFVGKHADMGKAHDMELKRAQKVLQNQEVKDDGSDVPAVKNQWQDKPRSLRELDTLPHMSLDSLDDLTHPVSDMIRAVHDSYYLRNYHRWRLVMARDFVESHGKERDFHADLANVDQRKNKLESLPSLNAYKDYVRE